MLILMEILGLVLEVMQRLQGLLELLMVGTVVMLKVTVVVPVQPLLGHIMRKIPGLVLKELLKLLEGFLVRHKPVLQRAELQMLGEKPAVHHKMVIRVEHLIPLSG